MPKSKREEFTRFEQELKKGQKKKQTARTPTGISAKDLFTPKSKEDVKAPTENKPNIDKLVDEAVKEIKKEETSTDKDVTSLFIEAQTKKQQDEGKIATSRYATPFGETISGDVYGKAGKGTGGYASLASSSPYKTGGNGTYGAANDAYGSNAYDHGKDGPAYKINNDGPHFGEQIGNDLSGIVKLTPARKAHEAHLAGSADPNCSYCKKAF